MTQTYFVYTFDGLMPQYIYSIKLYGINIITLRAYSLILNSFYQFITITMYRYVGSPNNCSYKFVNVLDTL